MRTSLKPSWVACQPFLQVRLFGQLTLTWYHRQSNPGLEHELDDALVRSTLWAEEKAFGPGLQLCSSACKSAAHATRDCCPQATPFMHDLPTPTFGVPAIRPSLFISLWYLGPYLFRQSCSALPSLSYIQGEHGAAPASESH